MVKFSNFSLSSKKQFQSCQICKKHRWRSPMVLTPLHISIFFSPCNWTSAHTLLGHHIWLCFYLDVHPLSLSHIPPLPFPSPISPDCSNLNWVTNLCSLANWAFSFWNLPNFCLYVYFWEYVYNMFPHWSVSSEIPGLYWLCSPLYSSPESATRNVMSAVSFKEPLGPSGVLQGFTEFRHYQRWSPYWIMLI